MKTFPLFATVAILAAFVAFAVVWMTGLKFGWLNALIRSARNSNVVRPTKRVRLTALMSQREYIGPDTTSVLTPQSP